MADVICPHCGADPSYWTRLLAVLAGPPTATWDTVARHRVILRRSDAGLLVCAIDRHAEQRPESLVLGLDLRQLHLKGEVAPVLDGPACEAVRAGEGLTLRLAPDPAATVLVH